MLLTSLDWSDTSTWHPCSKSLSTEHVVIVSTGVSLKTNHHRKICRTYGPERGQEVTWSPYVLQYMMSCSLYMQSVTEYIHVLRVVFQAKPRHWRTALRTWQEIWPSRSHTLIWCTSTWSNNDLYTYSITGHACVVEFMFCTDVSTQKSNLDVNQPPRLLTSFGLSRSWLRHLFDINLIADDIHVCESAFRTNLHELEPRF